VDEFWEERREVERTVDAEPDVGALSTRGSLLPTAAINILQPAAHDVEAVSSHDPLEGATQIIFPTLLHLDELEVDFLRVNELSARTLTMEHLHTSNLEVNMNV